MSSILLNGSCQVAQHFGRDSDFNWQMNGRIGTGGRRPQYAPPGSFTSSLDSALESGLSMAGVQKTKTGFGDKEKAYVVKSYTMLVCIIWVAIILSGLLCFVAMEVMQVTYVKKEVLHAMSQQELNLHHNEMRLIEVEMQLQQALEAHSSANTFISELQLDFIESLAKSGKEIDKILEDDTQVSEDTAKEVKKVYSRATRDILAYLRRTTKRIASLGDFSEKRLEDVSKEIKLETDREFNQQKRFEKRIKELGLNQDPNFDFRANVKETKNDDEEDDYYQLLMRDDIQEENEMKALVDRFYERLDTLDFPVLEVEVLDKWDSLLKSHAENLAKYEEKGIDLDTRQGLNIRETFLRALHKELEKSVPAKSLQKFQDMMEKKEGFDDGMEFLVHLHQVALLATWKQKLLDLRGSMLHGDIHPTALLGTLEELASKEKMYLVYDYLHAENLDFNFS